MRFDSIYLAGVGSQLPERVSTEHAVAEGWYDGADRRSSGIEAVAVGEIAAPDLAVAAAETALRRAGHDGDCFGAVLHSATYHQGPDGWSAPHYILRRTLNRPISAIEIRQGCVGMLAGLELAAHHLLAEPQTDAVLLTAADNFSVPLVDRWRASRLFLLADGGAAAVVSRHRGFARLLCVESVSNPQMEELHRCGEPLFPPGITLGRPLDFEARTAAWREASASASAPPIGHLGDMVADTVERALDAAGLAWEQVARVCHTGYARGALDAIVLDPLDIDAERGTFAIARQIGHVGAADPIIGLEALWVSEEVGAGDHVLLLAAGPGMQVTCAALEICASYGRDDERGG